MTVCKKKIQGKRNFSSLILIPIILVPILLVFYKSFPDTKFFSPLSKFVLTKRQEPPNKDNKISVPDQVLTRFLDQSIGRSERFLMSRNDSIYLESFPDDVEVLISDSGDKPTSLQRIAPNGNFIAYVRFADKPSEVVDHLKRTIG